MAGKWKNIIDKTSFLKHNRYMDTYKKRRSELMFDKLKKYLGIKAEREQQKIIKLKWEKARLEKAIEDAKNKERE